MEDKCKVCLEWATSRGASVNGIEVTQIPGRGTSLITSPDGGFTRDIFVPSHLLLNLHNIETFASRTPAFDKICKEWSARVPLTSRRAIILLMAFSKRHGSPWQSYLDALPESIDSPVFWSDEERALLRGTSISGVAEDKIEFLSVWLNYQQTRDGASDFTKSLTSLEIMHFEMLVDSRALLSNETDSCMVPIIDFANHTSGKEPGVHDRQNASWQSDTRGFHLRVQDGTEPGDEVLFSYGRRGNGELLCKYGFVEESQVKTGSRSVTIEIPLDESATFLQEFGEPSFRVMPDTGLELLSDDESAFIWIYVLLGEPDVDWSRKTYKDISIVKETLRNSLSSRSKEDWQWLQFKAYTLAIQCLSRQLRELDEAEHDAELTLVAASISQDRLAMIDAVRDSERITYQITIDRLSEKQETLMQEELIHRKLQALQSGD